MPAIVRPQSRQPPQPPSRQVPRLPATSEMDPTESPCDIHRSTADFREAPWSPRCMAWSQRGHRWQERCHAALQSCDPDLFWCDAGVGQEDSAGFSRHALVGGSAGPSCSGSSGDASVSILTKQTPLQSELSPGQSRLLSETRQSLHWCVSFFEHAAGGSLLSKEVWRSNFWVTDFFYFFLPQPRDLSDEISATRSQSQEISQPRDLKAKRSLSQEISQPRDLSHEISQPRDLTAKGSHRQEISAKRSHSQEIPHSHGIPQPRDLTAKWSHSQEISQPRDLAANRSQPRDLTAKRSHSQEVSQPSFVFTSSTFTLWGKSGTTASFSHFPLSLFEGSLARKLPSHIFHFDFLREVSRKTFVFISSTFTFWGKSRMKGVFER